MKDMGLEEQILKYLNQDEPDYQEAAQLGPKILPYLKKIIISEDDSLMASKATHLVSLIDDSQSLSILEIASESQHPEVRIASANGIGNILNEATLSESSKSFNNILVNLKKDSDIGVRKAASRALDS